MLITAPGPNTRVRTSRLSLVLVLCLPLAAAAEPARVEAPNEFQEKAIDAPSPNLGEEDEADAAAAQAEAIDEGKPTGLDRAARNRVEQIVVSARRREELLEDTPVTVTALSETTLIESGITQINQIQNLVPNMTYVQGISGQGPQIRIRGVGTTTAETAFDPGVGFYVDGVFLARATGQLLDTIDIQQVEVLRGPQGTLFGKNTVGGAVNVTTVKPKNELEGFVFVRPGNYGSTLVRGMLNLPIYEDVVATRLAVSAKNTDGYVDNVYRDELLPNASAIDFLGSVRVLPTDEVTIDVSGQYSDVQTNGRGGECVYVQPGALAPLVPSFEPACEAVSGPFLTTADSAQLIDVMSSGVWGTIQYQPDDFGFLEDGLLKSLTSWRRQSSRSRFDLDQSFYPAIQLSNAGGGALTDGEASHQQQIQQELQLNGSTWDGAINFVSGFFSYWESSNLPLIVRAQTDTFVTTTGNLISTDNFTWALYGQGTWDVTDWLALTTGVRYTSDTKSFEQEAWNPLNPAIPRATASDEKTFTSWTPMATVAMLAPEDWIDGTVVDHVMGYFTYSRGFKGGGFNAILQSQVGAFDPAPFDPETLDNFEIGVKTIGFDQLLTVNLAVFLEKYDDIQVAQFVTAIDENGMVTSQRITQNAAKATSKGVEVEVFSQPIDGVVLTANLGYLDARYDSYPDAENQLDAQPIDRSGETFDLTPKLQSFLAAQYSFEVEVGPYSSMNGWLTPRLEWAYRDHFHTVPPEVTAGIQRGYNLLNARLSYDFFEDRAQVALWAKNLLDEAYFSESFAFVTTFGAVSRFYEEPLTFGAELSYRF